MPVAAAAAGVHRAAAMAVAGAGIARLGSFIANPLIARGLLEPLFTQPPARGSARVDPEPLDFFLCHRDRAHLPAKARAFADHVAQALREHPALKPPPARGPARH